MAKDKIRVRNRYRCAVVMKKRLIFGPLWLGHIHVGEAVAVAQIIEHSETVSELPIQLNCGQWLEIPTFQKVNRIPSFANLTPS